MVAAALARGVFLGGGLIGKALGGALSGAGAAVGGLAQGVGSAVGGIGQGIGAAVGGAMTPAPKMTVNNFGIAGSAAKGKVTGGGTLPAPKKAATPTVNVNMPTEKLLVVAVNYLSSIDKTLQAQIKFERDAFVQQAQAERESAIESGGQKESIFTKLSDKFSGMSDDSTVKSRAGTITKAILAASGIAGLGLLALGNLDTKELDRLKDSYKAFNEKFDFLGPLAEGVASTGSIVGYLLKGVRGGIAGLVAEYLSQRFTGKSLFENITGTGEEPDGTQAPRKDGSYDYAMAGGLAGYAAYRGVKTFGKIKNARANIAKTQAAPRLSASGGRLGFRDPVTGKIASKAASSAGGGWLSGPKGRRFVAFLSKRFGKTFLAKKVMPLLARALVGIGVAATGIGVIPGALLTLITVASSAFLIYDIISAYWDWTEEEDALKDAQATSGLKPKPDAAPISGSQMSGSGNIAGAPTASAEQMQNLPSIPADIEKILATIRTRESGGNYGIPHPIGMPGQTASGAYAFTNGSWQGLTKKYGIGTEYSSAYLAPPPIQDAVAAKYVEEILQQAGGDVSKVPLAWYTGNIQGKISAKALAVNNGLTPQAYQAKWMADYTGGQYAASSYDSQGATGTTSAASSIGDLGKGAMQAIGSIAQATFGKQTPTTGSQLGGFNDTMEGNASRTQEEAAVAAQLGKMSSQIQTAVDLGAKDTAQAKNQQESAGAAFGGKTSSSNDSKREHFDPNFPGKGSIEKYMQYHKPKMAA
jgi:hypothetical protein